MNMKTNRTFKRIISLVLTIIMCCSVLTGVNAVYSVAADVTAEQAENPIDLCGQKYGREKYYYADSTEDVSSEKWFEYYLVEKDLVITALSDNFGDTLEIPDVVNGANITSVKLLKYTGIVKVCLADGIESFYCYNVRRVLDTFEPTTITTLKIGASFDIQKSNRNMLENDWQSFSDEARELYDVPEGITWWDNYEYNIWPESDLQQYELTENNTKYVLDEQGVLYSKDYKILYSCPTGKKLADYKIDDRVEIVDSRAFYAVSALDKVTLGENVTEIRDEAFRYCDKLEVKFNSKLKTLGNYAFADRIHSGVKNDHLNIPNGVETMGEFCFENCLANKITLPYSLKKIYDGSFAAPKTLIYNCKNLSLYSPTPDDDDSCTDDNPSVFINADQLKKVKIGKKVKVMNTIFAGFNGLKSIVIPKTVKVIDDFAFVGCKSLKKIKILGKKTKLKSCSVGFVKAYSKKKIKGVRIYAPKKSKAQKYAKKHGFKFKALK